MSGITAEDDAVELARLSAEAADAKGATDPVLVDVRPVLGICDVFVLVTAANDRQVKAVTDEVEARVAEVLGRRPRSVEGADARRWVLLDYGDVVVHVFQPEERSTYRLERLYADADRIDWSPPAPPGADRIDWSPPAPPGADRADG